MSANLTNKRSRVGYVAVGYVKESDTWMTSEHLYCTASDAIKNIQWCYNVCEDTIKTIRIELK